MKSLLCKSGCVAALITFCPSVPANIFFNNKTAYTVNLDVYDNSGSYVGYFEADPGWISLGSFPSDYFVVGYDSYDTVVMSEETPYPDDGNWELEFSGYFETSWNFLGTGVRLLGYSQNIVGQKNVHIPQSGYVAAPFNGFFGDSSITAIESVLNDNTIIDGVYVWQGNWVNGLVPHLSAGQTFWVESPSTFDVYWRGDASPAPGQSAITILPQDGVFATTLPLINENSGIPALPDTSVFDPSIQKGYTYATGYGWFDPVLGYHTLCPDIKLSAGVVYSISSYADITWTQQNPEHYPRIGDLYVTLDGNQNLNTEGGTAGYKVAFFKPKILGPKWLFAGSTSYNGSSLYVGNLLSSFGNEGFFQMVDSEVDNDSDQVPDWWEVLKATDAAVNDSTLDPDRNGISNYQEYSDALTASAQSLGFTVYNANQGARR